MDGYDYVIKLIIVGESGVGKSSILNMYCGEKFTDNYISTIGVDFKFKTLKIDDKKFKLQIWDTAGQERFRSITTTYFRGANAIMLVFDLTNVHSFYKVEYWLSELKTQLGNSGYKILLVGNKCDNKLAHQVNEKDIEDIVARNNIEYIMVSAKKNINIDMAFNKILKNVVESQIVSQNVNNTKTSIFETNNSYTSWKCCE